MHGKADENTLLEIRTCLTLGTFSLDLEHQLTIDGVTGLYGPSGAGKSTLLRVIAGLESSAKGRIAFAGSTWQDSEARQFVPAHQRPVGYVFQDARLFEHLDVAGNLRFADRRGSGTDTRLSFAGVVESLDLSPLLNRDTAELSGGERQRVAIGRSLLSRPRLMLFDEPLASLDAGRKQDILPYLEKVAAEFGIPSLYVSHSVEEIATLARDVMVMEGGRLLFAGDALKILNDPASQVGQSKFDAMTVLECSVIEHQADEQLTRLQCGSQEICVPLLGNKTEHDRVRLHVRAGDVAVATRRPERLSFRNVLEGSLVSIEDAHEGAFVIAEIDLGGQVIRAELTRQAVRELELSAGMPIFALLKTASFDRRH